MDKGDRVGRHDGGDPKDVLRDFGEVTAEVLSDDMAEPEEDLENFLEIETAEEKLFEFDIEVIVGVSLDDEADIGHAAVSMMRLRGALLGAIQMMQGGVMDLLSAGDFTPEMSLAVSTWGSGGQMLASASVEAIDHWLVEHELPTVSLYEVTSSNIDAMGWLDPHDPNLDAQAVVLFTNGSLYSYQGVPEDVFAEWWDADSQGVYLNTTIKGNYPHRKLIC